MILFLDSFLDCAIVNKPFNIMITEELIKTEEYVKTLKSGYYIFKDVDSRYEIAYLRENGFIEVGEITYDIVSFSYKYKNKLVFLSQETLKSLHQN